ncbi:hypothetical protein SteCoe_8438 [Stentor coeruleus]|uniref:Uncharacterized protein n=1 Tax=Stentor coeruleus TaxID=5963 RepID=A0A1R2CK96_9CILI|nr:hypothetical protein SteCoe_8438 [Stentor coeruleus]
MNVKIFTENFLTPRGNLTTSTTQQTARIIPKHKKSVSNILALNIPPTSLTDIKILTALTPRKIAEAEYKQKDIYDWRFDLSLNKSHKENQEIQEKQKKYEERKWREEEFNALREARNKIKEDEIKRKQDDIKRDKERFRLNQDIMIEKRKQENMFKKDKRVMFIENSYIKKKLQWEHKLQEREMSLDSLRLNQNSHV